ncbi:MAG: hypothetical protein ACI9Y1_003227, partial [Lentisphaeria bacterium]
LIWPLYRQLDGHLRRDISGCLERLCKAMERRET